MKKMLQIVFLALCLMGIVSSFCGCSQANAAGVEVPMPAVAILVGHHGCSLDLNMSSKSVQSLVKRALDEEGYLTVVKVDGDPQIVASGSLTLDQRYRQGDAALLEKEANDRLNALLAELGNIQADTPEVDTLEAIRLAVRQLTDAPDGAEKIILIVDTGLSTTGLLNFRNNLLNAEPEALAEELAGLEAIPDLTGIRVIWQQIGDVAYPQQELSPAQRNKLIAIWKAIIEQGNGSFELSDTPPKTAVEEDTLPCVSAVDLPADEPVVYAPTAELRQFQEPVILGEDQVQFAGDSAEYLDRDMAETTIKPIAEYLLEHDDQTLLLVGTTAGDGQNDYTLRLSQMRADTVKSTLVLLGVPENRVLTIGMGNEDPWHIYGAGTNGTLASQNRKVVLLDAGTETAAQLLQASE